MRNAADQASLTFVCACCRKTFPLAEGITKGTQVWCIRDNSTYVSLQGRWAKNAKLKTWWSQLTGDQKAEHFCKWQSVSNKRRFEDISYVERSIHAAELLDDEIDAWLPWEDFFLRYKDRPGATYGTLETEFQDIISTSRANCKQIRGEWFNSFSCLLAFCNADEAKHAEVLAYKNLLARLDM